MDPMGLVGVVLFGFALGGSVAYYVHLCVMMINDINDHENSDNTRG